MLGVIIQNIERANENGYIIDEYPTEIRIVSEDYECILAKISQDDKSALLKFEVKEKPVIESIEWICITPFNHTNGFVIKIKVEGSPVKWYKFKLENSLRGVRVIFKKYH